MVSHIDTRTNPAVQDLNEALYTSVHEMNKEKVAALAVFIS